MTRILGRCRGRRVGAAGVGGIELRPLVCRDTFGSLISIPRDAGSGELYRRERVVFGPTAVLMGSERSRPDRDLGVWVTAPLNGASNCALFLCAFSFTCLCY